GAKLELTDLARELVCAAAQLARCELDLGEGGEPGVVAAAAVVERGRERGPAVAQSCDLGSELVATVAQCERTALRVVDLGAEPGCSRGEIGVQRCEPQRRGLGRRALLAELGRPDPRLGQDLGELLEPVAVGR